MTNTNITATPEEKTDARLMAAEKFSGTIKSMLNQENVNAPAVRKLLDKEQTGFRAAAALCTHEPDWRIAELILQTLERTYRTVHAYMVSVGKNDTVSERTKDNVHAQLAVAAPAAEGIFARRQHYAQKHGNPVEKMTVEFGGTPTEPTLPNTPLRMPTEQLKLF